MFRTTVLCAALLGAGYAPTNDPMQNVSTTGFTSVTPVCSERRQTGTTTGAAGGAVDAFAAGRGSVSSANADATRRSPHTAKEAARSGFIGDEFNAMSRPARLVKKFVGLQASLRACGAIRSHPTEWRVAL